MSKSDEEAKDNPLMCMVDEHTGDKFARAVGQKGTGSEGEMNWLLHDMVDELKAWGHVGGAGGHVILKCDNENAIKAVRDAVGRILGGRVILEGPPKGESQSNGRIEEAGKTVRGFARVLKYQLEDKIGGPLDSGAPIMQWLVRWAAMLPSRFLVGKDQKTAYERRRGRKCKIPVEMFGEKVWYKELKGKNGAQNKLETDWHEGAWLGHARSSNEVLIGTLQGVVRAWAIKLKPEDEKWDADLIKNMKGTPAQPNPNKMGLNVPIRVTFDPTPPEFVEPQVQQRRVGGMPRQMPIHHWMLKKYGYTEDCKGCEQRRSGLGTRLPHNQPCRRRLEEAMAEDERGRGTKQRAEDRFNEWFSKEMEIADETKDAVEQGAGEKEYEHQEYVVDAGHEARDGEALHGERDLGNANSGSSGGDAETEATPTGIRLHAGANADDDVEKRECNHTPEEFEEVEEAQASTEEGEKGKQLGQRRQTKRPPSREFERAKKKQVVNKQGQKRMQTEFEEEVQVKKIKDDHHEEVAMEMDGIGAVRQPEGVLQKILKVKAVDRIRDGVSGKLLSSRDAHEGQYSAWDDLTGASLDPLEVGRARRLEIEYARRKQVWTKITRAEARRRMLKIIKVMWIDVNKGDAQNSNIRSRLVAKEFNNGVQDGLFAGTPPIEALRLLVSAAATTEAGEEDNVIMINDVSRAFFEAPIQRSVCIELPDEDLDDADREQDMVGLLQQSLYGTRDAAANFQKEVRTFMKGVGFRPGRYNPCTYFHPTMKLKTFVHGDDFVTTGSRQQCDVFKAKLETRFEIKTKLLGRGDDESKEERILNRVLRVTQSGWELEADQRHADILVRQLNLENAKPVSTPCDDKYIHIHEDEEELTHNMARQFRELAARANYLAQDRADIQYAVKEICRGMSSPTRGDHRKLKRLGRYLLGCRRIVMTYELQTPQETVRGWSDSDFAGCRKTAKSTSGGAITLGTHYIKGWSSTQKTIALSTAEAELTAVVKCSCEVIGVTQLAEDWNMSLTGDIFVDSSAALGVVARKGAGRLRHVRVGQLWVQQKAEDKELMYKKVKGSQNPADLMTKALQSSEVDKHLQSLGQRHLDGRARMSLTI